MQKKILYISTCLLIILIFISTNICYAAQVKVTKENLNESLQKFVKSDSNDENYTITMDDNTINIGVDEENYQLNYDLTDKPTFTVKIPITKGMTYEEFKEQTGNLMLPMLGYVAVANIEGVEFEDAISYFLSSIFDNNTIDNKYMIIDDTQNSEGVTIEKEENSNTIYASEFGDKVMEYVNSVYKDKQTISDSNNLNTYTWIVEKNNSTEDSCDLVSKITVNTDADFSKIKDFIKENNSNNDTTKEKVNDKTTKPIILNLDDKDTNQTNETANIEKMPRTGMENNPILICMYILIAISIISIFILGITSKNNK